MPSDQDGGATARVNNDLSTISLRLIVYECLLNKDILGRLTKSSASGRQLPPSDELIHPTKGINLGKTARQDLPP